MRILIFGGTTEAHRLSDKLCELSIPHTISVATEYGEQILTEDSKAGESVCRDILKGRMSDREIEELIESRGYDLIIDATHPYATEISDNIRMVSERYACKSDRGVIRFVRLMRASDNAWSDDMNSPSGNDRIYIYDDNEEAAEALTRTEGNILLTTGSKELMVYVKALGESAADRLFVRVIPSDESMDICKEAGIKTSHIIAMQGPFIKELNKALIQQYGISHLVTKDSGSTGGYEDKRDAAMECGIALHVIRRPSENMDIPQMCMDEILAMITGSEESKPSAGIESAPVIKGSDPEATYMVDISLVGTGMESYESLTEEAKEAMKGADVILGADRMVRQYCRIFGYDKDSIGNSGKLIGADRADPGKSKIIRSMYKPSDIADYVESMAASADVSGLSDGKKVSVAVLFSGDSGFNSGCKGVYKALTDTDIYRLGRLHIRILPGISSVSYLAAVTGRAYDTAYICSMHGKGEESIYRTAAHVRIERDVYALTSGYEDVLRLAKILTDCGMGDCRITVGCNLSLDDEKIICKRAEVLCHEADAGVKEQADILCTCHIYNPNPCDKAVSAGLSAEEFIRGGVPMTKEEVRTVTIDKLHLKPDSRVLDIGCGTGSVSVEIGRLIPDGMVYAIDRNEEAVELTKKNVLRHKLPNVLVYKGEITDILERIYKGEDTGAAGDGGLSTPSQITHAFIGGSGGRLSAILDMLKSMNPSMRIVVNAITDKTKDTLKEWIEENETGDAEVVRIQTDRGRAKALHEDMQAENGVYIYSFGISAK